MDLHKLVKRIVRKSGSVITAYELGELLVIDLARCKIGDIVKISLCILGGKLYTKLLCNFDISARIKGCLLD